MDDLRPYLAQATVAACPALYAVGVQNKVLEAMAMETPVICTSAALAGLKAQEDRDLLTADSPDMWAHQVLRISSDSELAGRLAQCGRRYVEDYHSWESATRLLVDAYEEARDTTPSQKPPLTASILR